MKSIDSSSKVSIIVPVYNVAEFLDQCIGSILCQTYSNIEVLVLNDGSTDDSLAICRKWETKDPRIKVFDNENRGVSYTRNLGLDNCTGKYVAFVDADDIVAQDYIEALVSSIESSGSDMSMCSYLSFIDIQPKYLHSNDKQFIEENLEAVFFTVTMGGIAGKLYKTDIIRSNALRIDECISVCEDLLFNIQYVSYCQTLVYSYSKLYGYRQRPQSAVHNNLSSKWFTVLRAYKYLFDNYSHKCISKYVVFYYLKFLYEANYLIRHKGIKPDFEVDLSHEIKVVEQYKHILTLREKLKLFICKHFFGFVLIKRR